jgi:membrane-associated phospholipid phosphatase
LNKDSIARIISLLLVPPSFTLIIFLIFALHLETEQTKAIVTILVAAVLGFAAPIILFLTFRKKELIVDIDASLKEERTIPMTISLSFFIAGLFILIIFEVNIISIAFWFCYISNTLITILINKRWKISVHTMGAAGSLAAMIFVFGPLTLLVVIFPVLVGWSRIQLKCHTLAEVFGGGILAFLSTYFQLVIITKIFA